MITKFKIYETYLKNDAIGYDIGEFVYHVTPKQNITEIKNNGFVPKNGTSINGKPFYNRLYFATSLIAAYDLSVNFGSWKEKNDEYIIFKLKSSCINDYEEDNLFLHGIYVDYPISYDCVVDFLDADNLFGKYDENDLENLYL